MKETMKYIRVLNWGYSGFAPMTLNKDFEKSLQQAQERLDLLDSLSEDALFVEATSPCGKSNLQCFTEAGSDFDHGLHFMRDRAQLLDAIPTMFKCFKDGADDFKTDGVWFYEQWREYKYTLNQIEKVLEDRLRQFAAAYGYSLDGETNDTGGQEPQQGEQPTPKELQQEAQQTATPEGNQEPHQILTINNTTKEKMVLGRALAKEYMELINGCYRWKKSKSLLAYMCGKLYCGDRVKVDESDYSDELIKGKNQLPRQALQQFFNVNVGNNRDQLKAPPRYYYLVDSLFEG